ncbi:hypothetical protein F7725_026936, partial [Dissostichus mawsoni]
MTNNESLFLTNLSSVCPTGHIETAVDGKTSHQTALNQQPLNVDYLEFLTRHELIMFESFHEQIGGVSEITEAIRNLHHVVRLEINASSMPIVEQETEVGPGSGQPKIVIEREKLTHLLNTHLPVSCIAKCLCVSRRTIYRTMQEFGLSIRGSYSTMTDQELDNIILGIKSQMPNAGYRMVQGHLVSMGLRVQWWRMMASMHRVDAAGIFRRITELGCVVRRSYSVRGPLSLVHIDTNHKLIRSCTWMLQQITEHQLHTHSPEINPASWLTIKGKGGSGSQNVDIAQYMFATRGTGRASFISGKSVHNQSLVVFLCLEMIERLWRDVWVAVSSKYHDVLHSLEEDGLLDISDVVHLFGVHYIFVPRLRADLDTFIQGWNNHPLRTEGGLTPEQLWCMGHLQDLDEGERLE